MAEIRLGEILLPYAADWYRSHWLGRYRPLDDLLSVMDSNQMWAFDMWVQLLYGMRLVIQAARRWLLENVPDIEGHVLTAYENFSVGLYRLRYSDRQDQIEDWFQKNRDPPLPGWEGGYGLDEEILRSLAALQGVTL